MIQTNVRHLPHACATTEQTASDKNTLELVPKITKRFL